MIHIAIVEDEALYLEELRQHIETYKSETAQDIKVSIFRAGEDIIDDYQAEHDIILMDMIENVKDRWNVFSGKHPGTAQSLVFFIVSNGVTVLQMILMPLFKRMLGGAGLVNMNFQILQMGSNPDGSPYYVFNYAAGALSDGGGFAYFLAVQITMAIAQMINFFMQRKVTFKSESGNRKAALQGTD